MKQSATEHVKCRRPKRGQRLSASSSSSLILGAVGARLLAATFCLLLLGALAAHEPGHKRPKTLPPVGPHGGKYGKLTRHYAEVVVRGGKVFVYILEHDVRHVAADATRVSAHLQLPRRKPVRLHLRKQKKARGYVANIRVPRRARRVFFHIRCVLNGKKEYGKIMYEPRR